MRSAGDCRPARAPPRAAARPRSHAQPPPLDPLQPSAYIVFCKEERKNITGMDFKETGTELGKRWKALGGESHATSSETTAPRPATPSRART